VRGWGMEVNPEENQKVQEDDFDAQQNLLGFFELLLKVDRRINPHLHKAEPEKINNPTLNA
jgi:hypothetical protein